MNRNRLQVKVVLAHECAFSRMNLTELSVPTPVGVLKVLPDDTNLMAALVPGTIAWQGPANFVEQVKLERGVLIKTGTNVLLLMDGMSGENHAFAGLFTGRKASDGYLSKMKDGHIASVVEFNSR